MKNATTVVIVFYFLFSTCDAQTNTPSVINASGGSLKTGYYSFEWSVGELSLVTQMNSPGNNLIVTNGFMQPYLLYPGTNNLSYRFGSDEIKIFPNPASDYIEINFYTNQKGKIKISLYDVSGKKVFYKETVGYGVDLIEKIPVSQFANGVYGLHIDMDADAGYVSKDGIYKLVKVK